MRVQYLKVQCTTSPGQGLILAVVTTIPAQHKKKSKKLSLYGNCFLAQRFCKRKATRTIVSVKWRIWQISWFLNFRLNRKLLIVSDLVSLMNICICEIVYLCICIWLFVYLYLSRLVAGRHLYSLMNNSANLHFNAIKLSRFKTLRTDLKKYKQLDFALYYEIQCTRYRVWA